MTRLPAFSPPEEALATPPCPHFEECGACQLQHVTPDFYHRWKEDQVKELLVQNDVAPEVWEPPVFIPAGTRRRVSFLARKGDENKVEVGFSKFHTHDLMPVGSCLLLTPALEEVLTKLPEALALIIPKAVDIDVFLQEADGGLLECVLTGMSEQNARQTAKVADFARECNLARVSFRAGERDEPLSVIDQARLTKTSGGLCAELPPGAFLQPSHSGEEALVAAVLKGLGKLTKKMKVVDLFAGIGTFAGRIAEIGFVDAVEGDPRMAAALAQAVKANARMKAEFRDLFKEPVTARELRSYSAVVFDPPRSGAKEQCQKLAASDVPLVVGVSCNPATFARDAKILKGGGYRLVSAQVIDQFIYSSHVEIVGVFKKG
ncbi:MAG: hypothetical protein WC043_02825 [Pseudobdellovibrionaceae bacterium]